MLEEERVVCLDFDLFLLLESVWWVEDELLLNAEVLALVEEPVETPSWPTDDTQRPGSADLTDSVLVDAGGRPRLLWYDASLDGGFWASRSLVAEPEAVCVPGEEMVKSSAPNFSVVCVGDLQQELNHLKL